VHRCTKPSLPSAIIIGYFLTLPVIMVLIAAPSSLSLPSFYAGGFRSISSLQPSVGSPLPFWIINAFPPT
jgi:hypothetical protein